ncbi:MAG: hemerythrin domain-containing protein [Alphaproteobacteria bacterium]
MKLTDLLRGEHAAFNALLDEIEELNSVSGEVAQIESTVTVLKTELRSHAALEEKLLFPALKPFAKTDELFAEMHADHERIRHELEQIENARDIDEALDAVGKILGVARRHFKSEEEKLYGLADEALDEEALDRLSEAWAAARSEKRS